MTPTRPPLWRPFAALLLFACATPAFALTEYCVGSSSGLRAALNDAEVDGDDSLVRIRSGTIVLAQDAIYDAELEGVVPAGDLTLRGGYNSDCSDYSLAAGATVIDSTNASRLSIITETGNVAVNGLTFDGAFLRMISQTLAPCPGSRRQFSTSRVRIDGASLDVSAWCHDVKISNSLFTNGVALPGGGLSGDVGVGIYLAFNEEAYNRASKLTMINSTISNGRLQLVSQNGLPGSAAIYNSVFVRSGNEIVSDANLYIRNSRYDGIGFGNGALLQPGSGENSAAAAQLDASYVPQPGSPAVNLGTSNVPGGLTSVDHTGNDRVIGARPDMGALESPTDGSGVYTVTNTNASGNGSLAWALEQSNLDDGFNQIRFNIPGGCPKRITPGTSLKVYESVFFDGSTQPGHVANTQEIGFDGQPCIVLNGGGTRGIGIETMGDLNAGNGFVSVRGLAFENYDLAISLAFGTAHRVQGSQFGGPISGSGGGSSTTLAGNTQAIAILGGTDTVIGGDSPAQRNMIAASSDIGVWILQFLGGGGNDNRVVNNLIGLDRFGATAVPNGTGIVVNGGNNEILGNRIGGNSVDGIRIAGDNARGNVVQGNWIGGGTGSLSLTTGNGRMGVMLEGGAWANAIGPDNLIGRNGDDGVRVMPDAGGYNSINGNRIARNDALGIDLGSNGVSTNDPDPGFCQPPEGCSANAGQNFPVLTDAVRARTGLIPVDTPVRIEGTLRSLPGGPYRIEVFGGDACDANGYGEGQRLLAAKSLTIENEPYCPDGGGLCFACTEFNCTAGFTVWVSEVGVAPGDAITLTATSPGGNTSEFSQCMTLVDENTAGDAIFADGFED
ncbi:right-handed parallel beta-helix repeat-containing protein [Chiayiivirga flava]|uniref:Right handed beta helix domain-containing protein n=1 Tax=Chiayiivirga flava TaxID=659595 RepID=A0A7W8D7D4_9GAMM|nr:right-handed parallel beta-helix repeat-containing protein [Chiayiivirga flava]MBB5207633.1 hypothetical protein [Chiayiivirga flava]